MPGTGNQQIQNPVTVGSTLTSVTALLSLSAAIPNNHGFLLRNGPIGVTANTDTLNFAYAGTGSPPTFSLAPGEAFTFDPADVASTDHLFLASASGGNLTVELVIAG